MTRFVNKNSGTAVVTDNRFRPMTDEEMELDLDETELLDSKEEE